MQPVRITVQELDISFKEAENLFNSSANIDQFDQANRLLFGEFLNVYCDRFSNYVRFKKTLQFRGLAYSVSKEEVIFKNEKISASAAAIKYKEALNMTSSILIREILSKDKFVHMPRYLIGLPNYRGHCFFVPVFVYLFNNYSFVNALYSGFYMANQYIQGSQLTRPEATNNRFSIYEGPFLWTRIVKRFLHAYKKASLGGDLKILNRPMALNNEDPQIYSEMLRNYRSDTNYRSDLRLDRTLLKIVLELADFESKDFETPGGLVTKLYRCIITKLDYEYVEIGAISPFNKVFFTKVKFDYVCYGNHLSSLVPGIPAQRKKSLSLPCIRVPNQHKVFTTLQEFINDTGKLILFQEDICKQYKQSLFCNSKMEQISNVVFEQLPEILVIDVIKQPNQGKRTLHNLEFPESIQLGSKIYKKVAYSVNFECWADKTTKILKSIRMTEPDDDDVSVGWHIMLQILTDMGYMEVNNHQVFTVDSHRTMSRPYNMIFYIDEKIPNYIPKVGNYFLDENNFIQNVSNSGVIFQARDWEL